MTVELDPADAGPGRYVREVKNIGPSLREALAETAKAMANRDVAASVLVFARDDQNPCRVPLQTFEQVIVVTVDKDDPERTRRLTAGLRMGSTGRPEGHSAVPGRAPTWTRCWSSLPDPDGA